MKKYILLLFIILFSCNSNQKMEPKNIKITPLSPYTQEHKNAKNDLVREDFFYLSGTYSLNDKFYKNLNEIVKNHIKNNNDKKYTFYAVYVFKETNKLNESFNIDEDASSDSYNSDLLAHVLFKNNELYVFNIIDGGNIVYDLIENKEVTHLEFDEGVVLKRK